MNHLGLFEGIGGFSLAAEWMGWNTIAWCEKDKKCQEVLRKHFPNAIGHEDIFDLNGKEYQGKIDIITGGFPCQPFSVAGKRNGRDDDRYLWPEMLRIIREVQPTYVVCENVAGLLSMENGELLRGILINLESQGYSVETFIIPACGVQAWHRRARLWIIAYRTCQFGNGSKFKFRLNKKSQTSEFGDHDKPINSNHNRERGQRSRKEEIQGIKRLPRSEDGRVYGDWGKRPDLYSPILYRSNDGIPNRVDRLKQLGNAIVPQVVFEIFKAIDRLDKLIPKTIN